MEQQSYILNAKMVYHTVGIADEQIVSGEYSFLPLVLSCSKDSSVRRKPADRNKH